MKSSWLKGLDKDAEKEMRMAFTSSLILRQRLARILLEKEELARNNNRKSENYECPNWAYKQADLLGYERALREILNLIEK